MQTLTGGIQRKGHLIIQDGKVHLELDAGFRQPADTVLFTQTLGCGLLDDGLAVRNTHELGIQAVALYGELAVLGNVVFQIGMVHTLEQFFKSLRFKTCQHNHDTLCGTQADVGFCQCCFVAGEENTAVFHAHIFHAHAAQLITCQTFQAEQSRRDQFKFSHSILH